VRILAFLEFALVTVGVIGMIAARFFFLPKGFHLGVFSIGAGLAVGGLESLFTRQMSFRFSSHGGAAYSGAPAVIWGAMLLAMGCALIASAYLMDQGSWQNTVASLTRRPGLVIAAGGLLAMALGALFVFNRGQTGLAWMLLVRVPKTLLGALLIVGGLAAIGLGLVEWIDHEAYVRIWRRASEALHVDTVQRLWRGSVGRIF
jgi:hypothetical protein